MKYTLEDWNRQRDQFMEITCNGDVLDEMMRPYTKKLWDSIEVGDGVTVNYWTDCHAYTVIKRTAKTMTLRRCKAILDSDWKPQFIPGGFAGHTVNNSSQTYTYEEDENGKIMIARWSEKHCRFFADHILPCSPGRHEFYDYNF